MAKNNIEAPVQEKKDQVKKTVEVNKDDLESLLNRLDKYQKDIEILYKASDKQRLAQINNDANNVLVRKAKIRKWSDTPNYIIGWSGLHVNKCEVVNGRWIEEQTTTVFLDNGESIEASYLEKLRNSVQFDEGDIIGKEKKIDPSIRKEIEIFEVQFPSGRTIKIDSRFIN